MRYYLLYIGGQLLSQLNQDNAESIRISFQLQATTQVTIPNAIIKLHTLPSEFFLQNLNWIGKEVELHAGILATPLTNMISLKPPMQTLILRGYIHQIIANPNEKGNNSLQLIINPSKPKTSKEVTTPEKPEDKGFLLSIKKGDDLKKKFKEAVSGIYPLAKVETQGEPVITQFEENLIINSIEELQKRALQNKIQIFVTSDGYSITDLGKLPATSTIIDFGLSDFLEQPSLIADKKISITSFLRADIKPQCIINIKDNLFYNNTLGLKALGTKPSLFLTGQWRVVNVWHIGDSRGEDLSAWQTSIEAVKL